MNIYQSQPSLEPKKNLTKKKSDIRPKWPYVTIYIDFLHLCKNMLVKTYNYVTFFWTPSSENIWFIEAISSVTNENILA